MEKRDIAGTPPRHKDFLCEFSLLGQPLVGFTPGKSITEYTLLEFELCFDTAVTVPPTVTVQYLKWQFWFYAKFARICSSGTGDDNLRYRTPSWNAYISGR